MRPPTPVHRPPRPFAFVIYMTTTIQETPGKPVLKQILGPSKRVSLLAQLILRSGVLTKGT